MDDVVRQVLENEHHLRLKRRIGWGGFAEVWSAESPGGVPCAVKVSLRPIDADNPAVQKELDNLQRLKSLSGHPRIVSLMGILKIGGYLVTHWELAQEGTLQDLLVRYQGEGQSGVPLQELIRYMGEAAEGIDFLNGHGIYHRDIKPANLLLFLGHVKIGDLGLAKFVGASTGSHTGAGTLGYLPPEAYNAKQLSPTVDLYSLAATYLKLRTGREPFGDNPVEIIKHQEAGQPDLRGLKPDEAEVVRRALAPNPEDRPGQGACQWVRDLYQALRGSPRPAPAPIPPPPPPPIPARPPVPPTQPVPPRPSWPSLRSVVVGAAVVVLAILAAWAIPYLFPPSWQVRRTLEGHTYGVVSVAFSPDGQTLASGSDDKTIRLWRVSDGSVLHTLEGHTDWVRSVAFSPDGQTLASGSYDKTIRLWRVSDGSVLRTLKGHTDWVLSVAFSPDGQTLASGSRDKTIRLWRVSDGSLLHTLEGHTYGVRSVAFSPDGQTLASASWDNTIRLWRVSNGSVLRTLEGHTYGVLSVAFSPDGQTLASGSDDSTIRLWRVSDGSVLYTLKGHTSWVRSVAFSPDGQTLASGSWDKTIRLWRVSDGSVLRTLKGHTGSVWSVAFSPDGQRLASGSRDTTIRLWGPP